MSNILHGCAGLVLVGIAGIVFIRGTVPGTAVILVLCHSDLLSKIITFIITKKEGIIRYGDNFY
jgi:hypothetical protein